MNQSALVATAALASLLASAVPAAAVSNASTNSTAAQYRYYRFDVQPLYRPGIRPIATGDFELQVDAKGEVNGYFRAYDSGRYVPVIGEQTGRKVWLEIGLGAGPLDHLNGQLDGAQIDGTGHFEGGNVVFHAIPEASLGV